MCDMSLLFMLTTSMVVGIGIWVGIITFIIKYRKGATSRRLRKLKKLSKSTKFPQI